MIILNTYRCSGKTIALKEYIKGLDIPIEKELINSYTENYLVGTGVLLEPRVFNPKASFEHIRKQNDKRIFRVR